MAQQRTRNTTAEGVAADVVMALGRPLGVNDLVRNIRSGRVARIKYWILAYNSKQVLVWYRSSDHKLHSAVWSEKSLVRVL